MPKPYSHARSAFDPSAYARNQKATSLTRVSVTHQPLKIPPGWLASWAACLPACLLPVGSTCPEKERRTDSKASEKLIVGKKRLLFSESGKLENSAPRTPVYPSSTACEWQTLNEKERDPFYPSGTNRGLFPRIPNRRGVARYGARMHSRMQERGNGSRYPAVISDPYYKMPSSPILPRCTYIHLSLLPSSLSLSLVLPVEPLNR